MGYTRDEVPISARSPWKEYLIERFGVDYFDNVVDVSMGSASDEKLAKVAQLSELETLFLGGEVTDAGRAQLTGLTRLRTLTLCYPSITDDGLASLEGAGVRGLKLPMLALIAFH